MIRIALIGTGSIADAHLEAYTRFPDRCQVVALVNNTTEKAHRLKIKYKLDCQIMQDYRELLIRKEVDLVSICIPPQDHAAVTIDCLKAGKHVLLEKPMAMSLEECDRMIEAAEASGRILSVVAQNRYFDHIVKLKTTLDSGLVGKIAHAKVESHWWRGQNYYDLWWRGTWETEGGGCTLNHGVHHIDILQWMMGMPQTVQAVISNALHSNSEVEDISVALLSYSNGSIAQFTCSVNHHGEEQQIVFHGEKARVSAPWKIGASTQMENGFPKRNNELEKEIERYYNGLASLPFTGHSGQIDDILSSIERGSLAVMIDGHEGRKVIELVTAIYEAAIIAKPVQLPLTIDSPLYTREGILTHAPRFNKKLKSVASFGTNEITLGGNNV
ncbi:Gfo/Idh/MocA family protein [Paenibacillus qinlingensis]|uniref:Gfo/Idh/MocA family protein n=1 Tax=Paenibacillus qinlingensis TaxID=1837343 RepID=UPI0015642600|nr:Gfo/Idh/MocA family oxidoreductase [Paenibacillus qinlingensis]NQX63602.1 Gfo/Idh/MocA family oxidoreductase [Paenibacillus qinlingensis]